MTDTLKEAMRLLACALKEQNIDVPIGSVRVTLSPKQWDRLEPLLRRDMQDGSRYSDKLTTPFAHAMLFGVQIGPRHD